MEQNKHVSLSVTRTHTEQNILDSPITTSSRVPPKPVDCTLSMEGKTLGHTTGSQSIFLDTVTTGKNHILEKNRNTNQVQSEKAFSPVAGKSNIPVIKEGVNGHVEPPKKSYRDSFKPVSTPFYPTGVLPLVTELELGPKLKFPEGGIPKFKLTSQELSKVVPVCCIIFQSSYDCSWRKHCWTRFALFKHQCIV